VTGGAGTSGLAGRSGQTLVEFSVVALLTAIMLLFVVEIGRVLLVYTTVANAARAGVRYAIVHGNTRSAGATVDNASGPGNDPTQVVTVVKNFASGGLLTTSRLVVHVTYPGGSNAPGQYVNITVVYPYDPLTTYFSHTFRLGSATQGIIVF
jgi:Flp pilus assembly protein TadG